MRNILFTLNLFLIISSDVHSAFLFECGEYKLRGIFYKERLNRNLVAKAQHVSAGAGNYLLVFFKGGLGEIEREVTIPPGQESQLPKSLKPNQGHHADVIIKVKSSGGTNMEFDLLSIGPTNAGLNGLPTKGEVKKLSDLPCETAALTP